MCKNQNQTNVIDKVIKKIGLNLPTTADPMRMNQYRSISFFTRSMMLDATTALPSVVSPRASRQATRVRHTFSAALCDKSLKSIRSPFFFNGR